MRRLACLKALAAALLVQFIACDAAHKGTGLTLSDDVLDGEGSAAESGSTTASAAGETSTNRESTASASLNSKGSGDGEGVPENSIVSTGSVRDVDDVSTDVVDSNSLSLFTTPSDQTGEDEKFWEIFGYWRQGGNATVSELEERASSGDVEGLYNLGVKYLLGLEVARDAERAYELFQQGAISGHPHSQTAVGLFHNLGFGAAEVDLGLASLYHSFASMGGGALSDMVLGYQYHRSQRCELATKHYQAAAEKTMARFADPGKAPLVEQVRLNGGIRGDETSEVTRGHRGEDDETIQFILYTAERGNTNSLRTLGTLYYWGARGIARDLTVAAQYFRRAAEGGDPHAMVNLGEMLARGIGMPDGKPNHESALHWFREGAAKGEISAQNGLGYLYAYGRGVEKDFARAFKQFSVAAANGDADGQYNVGVMYASGMGVQKDAQKAVRYFQLAAMQQHMSALYQLARFYTTGRAGIRKSCGDALRLFKVVAEKGEWGSLLRWAHEHYMNGNAEASLIIYLKAAMLGYEVAQSNAAWLLDQKFSWKGQKALGNETWRNEQRQMMWKLAASQGSVDAALSLGDAHYYGKGVPLNYGLAADAYRQATQQRSAQAAFNLGYMHESGKGVPVDFHLAKRFYDEAIAMDKDAYVPSTLALQKLWLMQEIRKRELQDVVDNWLAFSRRALAYIQAAWNRLFPSAEDSTSPEASADTSSAEHPMREANEPLTQAGQESEQRSRQHNDDADSLFQWLMAHEGWTDALLVAVVGALLGVMGLQHALRLGILHAR